MGPRRDLVLVGASAGGLPALRTLLGELPPGVATAVLVVVHPSEEARTRTARPPKHAADRG